MVGLIFGSVGGAIVVASFAFQGYKTYSDKDLNNLSPITFAITYITGLLWASVGLFHDKLIPSYTVNFFIPVIASYVLYNIFKKRFNNKKIGILIFVFGSLISIGLFAFNIINGESGVYIKHSPTISFWLIMISGGLMAISFVPQLISTIKTNDTHNLSFGMLFLNSIAQVLTIVFWFLKIFEGDDLIAVLPGLVWISITFGIILTLLVYKTKALKKLKIVRAVQ